MTTDKKELLPSKDIILEKVRTQGFSYRRFKQGNKLFGEYKFNDGSVGQLEEDNNEYWDCYSAFTVAELGEMLPLNTEIHKQVDGGFKGIITNEHNDCECCGEKRYKVIDESLSETEADARAKMLIYIIEEKLIEVKP